MPAQIPEDDSRIETETVSFEGASGTVSAYVAKPAGADNAPAVVIIHENRGLQPHIKDVARRAAVAGFIAVAPDFQSQVGGTPDDADEAVEKTRSLDMAKITGDAVAAAAYARSRPDSNGKVGSVGFCWGGALSNQLAVHDPELDAGVVFYGRSPADEDVPKIKARMLLNYGSLDENINAGVPGYEEALKAAGTDYTIHMYEGGKHAFHNDDNPDRHHPENAKLAWSRTVDFLKESLAA
ncbi:MAG: dienelactone hydrolase family protein [Alphaproteobacteria bacterium]|nr:dienelactone hydrolase family protein [Alphaproteobacteria bacterium]